MRGNIGQGDPGAVRELHLIIIMGNGSGGGIVGGGMRTQGDDILSALLLPCNVHLRLSLSQLLRTERRAHSRNSGNSRTSKSHDSQPLRRRR